MATRTDNLKLSKAETSDAIKSTLTANNQNFDKLDGVITRLRNNQLTGTASGTEIVVEDSAEMESVLQLGGNSEQNNANGNNFFDINAENVSAGELKTILSESSIKITSNNTAGYVYTILRIPNSQNLLGKTCVLKLESAVPSAKNAWQIAIHEYSTANGLGARRLLLNKDEYTEPKMRTVTFLNGFTDGAEEFVILLYANAGGTAEVGDYVIYDKIQLEEGSVPTEYEPYGIEPSPTNKSEIKSIKSKSDNFFDSDYSLATKGGFVKQSDGSYYRSAVTVANAVWENTEGYTGQFTITGEMKWVNYGSYAGETIHVEYTDGTKVSTQKGLANANFRDKFGSFQYTTDSSKVVKQINLSYGDKSENYFRNIMMVKGNKPVVYQPYGYVPLRLKLESENLFFLEDNELKTNYEKLTCLINNQSITLDGDSVAGNILPILRDDKNEEVLINLEAKQTYYFKMIVESGTTSGTGDDIQLRNKDRLILSRNTSQWISGFYYTPVEDLDATWARMYFGARTFDNYKFKLLISKKVSSNWLEAAPLKIINIPLGDIQLRSSPDGVKDVIAKRDNKWNKFEYVPSILFDGSDDEDWSNQNGGADSVNRSMFVKRLDIATDYPLRKSYCDRFKYYENGTVQSANTDVTGFNFNPGRVYSNYIYFKIEKNLLLTEDVAGWRTWLANNPIEVAYPLKTPNYIPITDEGLIASLDELEGLILNKGYNHITVTSVNGLKAYLDLTYYKDINMVLDNITASILSLGGGANV